MSLGYRVELGRRGEGTLVVVQKPDLLQARETITRFHASADWANIMRVLDGEVVESYRRKVGDGGSEWYLSVDF